MRKTTTPQQPIGIFDSGIGGLTVAQAIAQRLPNERLIYFGDTAHLPYGDKSADAIRYYCLGIGKFLLDQGCKMIVVACNSAATAGYRTLIDFFRGQALFVNVVDPLVETVAARNFKKVGVIATKATIRSGVYERMLHERNPNMEVVSLATPLLAPMIEEGYIRNGISEPIIRHYLSYEQFEGIEAILLACTHYPLIRSNIENFFEGKVEVFDSTHVVAVEVEEQLTYHHLLSDQRRQTNSFFVSDHTPSFESTTKLFYGEEVHLEQSGIWG